MYKRMARTLKIGSRRQVWNGSRMKTKGGLTRKQLKMNKRGRIVSKKLSNKARRDTRLTKNGYKTKKGTFKLFKRQ